MRTAPQKNTTQVFKITVRRTQESEVHIRATSAEEAERCMFAAYKNGHRDLWNLLDEYWDDTTTVFLPTEHIKAPSRWTHVLSAADLVEDAE